LLKHLEFAEPTKAGRFKEGDLSLREQCVSLLNSKQVIRLALDLDDIESAGLSRNVSPAALGFALECGAVALDKSYSLTQSGEQLSLSEFSSGQWHILSSLLFVSLAVEDDTLILIDEPENSLHPQWQREYLNLFAKAISSCDGVHVIVATHSPLVASSLPPDQAEVIKLGRTRFGNVVAQEVAAGPFGWTTDDILEKVFGLRSTRSQLFATEMDRALKLFAKGDRKNPALVRMVGELAEFAKSLPEDDVARSVISTLRSVILPDAQDTTVAER
jgi:ABC-type glutathione transport system ATPase component